MNKDKIARIAAPVIALGLPFLTACEATEPLEKPATVTQQETSPEEKGQCVRAPTISFIPYFRIEIEPICPSN